MKPSVQWMQENFDIFNERYFGGRLKYPKFSIFFRKDYWGYYQPNGDFNRFNREFYQNGTGTIYLNGNFERSERGLQCTLIHEMIHMYVNTVMKIYPRDPHGDEFYSIANRINMDGWNIGEIDGGDDVDDGYDDGYYDNTTYLLCILEQPNHNVCKYWGFKADEDVLDRFVSTCKSLKTYGATKLSVYECTDGALQKLPSSHEKLLGVGADDVNTLFIYLSRISGGRISSNNLKLINEIQL